MRYDVRILQEMAINVGYLSVSLDGKELVSPPSKDYVVIAFDPNEGFVEVHSKDADGKVITKDDKYVTEKLSGVVRCQLTRRSDGGWPHGTPEPDSPTVDLLESLWPLPNLKLLDPKSPMARPLATWLADLRVEVEQQAGELAEKQVHRMTEAAIGVEVLDRHRHAIRESRIQLTLGIAKLLEAAETLSRVRLDYGDL